MKFSLQSMFIFGIFNVIYAVIKFFKYQSINNSLYLGLLIMAICLSGLKIMEMWERQKKHSNK